MLLPNRCRLVIDQLTFGTKHVLLRGVRKRCLVVDLSGKRSHLRDFATDRNGGTSRKPPPVSAADHVRVIEKLFYV